MEMQHLWAHRFILPRVQSCRCKKDTAKEALIGLLFSPSQVDNDTEKQQNGYQTN
jgi:hypothetical protein